MTEIEKAEKALKKAKEEATKMEGYKQKELNEFCIEKTFKSINTFPGTYVEYIHVIDYVRYNDGKMMYESTHGSLLSETCTISLGVGGYFIDTSGDLKYKSTNNRVSFPIKKHYTKGGSVAAVPNIYNTYFSPKSKNDKGEVYDGNNWYVECTKEEYNEVRSLMCESQREIGDKFKRFADGKFKENDHFYDITIDDIAMLKTFVKEHKGEFKTLKSGMDRVKKTLNLVQYASNNAITELEQYRIEGEEDKGLNLYIEGGDDGTDYEPYVTRYILHTVNIDWLKVLYPIRTKLDSVRGTAAELEKLKDVYSADNWTLNWSGSYDVSFDGATLDAGTLSKVNNRIKKHLK